ncbi:hypothetical protein [Marinimicrobium sp. C2-29]|uniref:hypothetical protein n=1 Tax=Marinimicrobium sp. C2-29 TaxID=3139825 RepID=UPI00313946BC
MSQCPPIIGLNLDVESNEAIERIREKTQFGRMLGATLTAGVFNSIFTKSKAPVSGYNITQTDWRLYTEAINAIPTLTKRAIRQEIDMMLVHYQMPGKYDHNHVEFWRGLKNGCQIP